MRNEHEDASSMCESELPKFAMGMELFSQFKQLNNNVINRDDPKPKGFLNVSKPNL